MFQSVDTSSRGSECSSDKQAVSDELKLSPVRNSNCKVCIFGCPTGVNTMRVPQQYIACHGTDQNWVIRQFRRSDVSYDIRQPPNLHAR